MFNPDGDGPNKFPFKPNNFLGSVLRYYINGAMLYSFCILLDKY